MIAGLRFFYNRSGEILTLLVLLAIGAYILVNLVNSSGILDHEAAARTRILEIHRLEIDALNSGANGRFRPLSALKAGSPDLANLIDVTPAEAKATELFRDDHYFYFLLLEYPAQSAEDYGSDHRNDEPSGFRAMAWPATYAITGETAYYIDPRGILAVSINERARYEGSGCFPPDWQTPASALEEKNRGKNLYLGSWRLDPPPK